MAPSGRIRRVESAFSYARDHNVPIRFMGLTSSGGVHSSLDHLYALCDTAKAYGLDKVYLHCFMDGRDTDPRSGAGFLAEVREHCAGSAGKIASVIGRYYAMDRDKALGAPQTRIQYARLRRGPQE